MVMGAGLFAVSVPRAWQEGLYLLVAADALALAGIIAMWGLRRRWPTLVTWAYVGVVVALGAVLLTQVGPVAQVYLLGAAFVAALLLGRSVGLLVVGASALAIVALGWAEWLTPRMLPYGREESVRTWIVVALNFSLVGVLLVLAFEHVVASLERALHGERQTRQDLEAVIREKDRAIQRAEASEARLEEAAKMEALARLAGGVAHDVNNMLSVMIGHAMLLREEPAAGADVVREEMDAILTSGQRSADLMRQLLAFARRQASAPQRVVLDEWLAQARTIYEHAVGHGCVVAWELRAPGVVVYIDPAHVDEIVFNLLTNARQALPQGGKIVVTTRLLPPGASPQPAAVDEGPETLQTTWVLLQVRDEGVGMPPAVLTHVFEPFFTTRTRGGGAGLGLSTVYGLVKQGGGTIEVESTPGEGTTVRLWLPLAQGGAPSRQRSERGAQDLGGDETLLLVEDEPALLALNARVLRAAGYEVLTASDGAAALARLQDRDQPIDLLITDVMMPGMSGPELWVAAREHRPGLACLFVSGYTQDALARDGAGVLGWPLLQKPFAPQALVELVREILDGQGIAR